VICRNLFAGVEIPITGELIVPRKECGYTANEAVRKVKIKTKFIITDTNA
jgi:hypothetical protein